MISTETAYAAMESRDPRFDGQFYIGVITTGVYCRPSCPAVLPRRQNVRLFTTAAAAQVNGFRACKRCRPDTVPGSPEWNVRADLAGRAMRLIADGVVDREGVAGLAARLGYTQRQVHRQLVAEVGAGPQALARAQRAQTARTLLDSTGLRAADIAFAAGFSSVRQFNDTIRRVYGSTPTRLRTAARSGNGAIELRLAYRAPLDLRALLDFLGEEAIPSIEEYDGETYRRSLTLPHGIGVVALRDGGDHVRCELRLDDLRDLAAAVRRCRRLLDLDADIQAITELLGADPVLGPLVAARPGLRLPGHVDPAELATRTVLGQAAATALVQRYAEPLPTPVGGVTHTFPDLGMFSGLHAGTEWAQADRLGLGARDAALIRMRGLGDPDVPLIPGHPRSGRWRPWRSYAGWHLLRAPG